MIDNLCILMSTGLCVYVVAQAIRLDRMLPWFAPPAGPGADGAAPPGAPPAGGRDGARREGWRTRGAARRGAAS